MSLPDSSMFVREGRLADLNGGFHADLDGLLVHRDEVVVTGREGLFPDFDNASPYSSVS